jgi:hypothetical protein
MAPLIVLKDGQPRFALGLPGGLRIFPSALQAVLNLIDHGMSCRKRWKRPRVWTQGFGLELEPRFPDAVADALRHAATPCSACRTWAGAWAHPLPPERRHGRRRLLARRWHAHRRGRRVCARPACASCPRPGAPDRPSQAGLYTVAPGGRWAAGCPHPWRIA